MGWQKKLKKALAQKKNRHQKKLAQYIVPGEPLSYYTGLEKEIVNPDESVEEPALKEPQLPEYEEQLRIFESVGFSKEDLDAINRMSSANWTTNENLQFFRQYMFEFFANLKQPGENEIIEFKIKAQFNKNYYISAKLADYAQEVYFSRFGGRFHVIFNLKDDFEYIEQLYFTERKFIGWTLNKEDIEKIQSHSILGVYKYVAEKTGWMSYNTAVNGIPYVLPGKSQEQIINDIEKNVFLTLENYLTVDRFKIIYSIIEKRFVETGNNLYALIKSEGRVNITWKREYELFVCIKAQFDDAIFQYALDNRQSFDIYIPSRKVAIEYQGKQHYAPVEYFGGEAKLKEQQEMDQRKRQYAAEHDIQIIYWPYDQEFNRTNFIVFFEEYGQLLQYDRAEMMSHQENEKNYSIEMAPKQIHRGQTKKRTEKEKEPKAKITHNYYGKYNVDGELVAIYHTAKEAADSAGISCTSMLKVIKGERKTSGGYLWRRGTSENELARYIEV